MNRRTRYALRRSLIGLACLGVSGCASTPTGPPTVGLSIVAPTDGSTVGVRAIEIVGKVTPANARVLIGHRQVRVRKGTFRQPLVLLAPVTHIPVNATAEGFRGSSTVVAVRYSAKLLASHHVARSGDRGSSSSGGGSPSGGGSSSGGSSGAQHSMFTRASQPDFMAGCTHGAFRLTGFCDCVWSELEARGFDTRAKWEALLATWRRSFLARGVIVYPPALKETIVSCVPKLTQQ